MALNFHKPKTLGQWLVFLAAIGITLSTPGGSHALHRAIKKEIEKRTRRRAFFSSLELTRMLYRYKKRKLTAYKENSDGTVSFVLTERGRSRKLQYDFELLTIQKPAAWDGRWRVLMFDIPEGKKRAREALRDKIRELGFSRFQKSVWVYPYPCQDEIDFIAEIFKVQSHIILLTAHIEDDVPLRTRFNLD